MYGDCLKEKTCSCLKAHILETFLIADVENNYSNFLEIAYDPGYYARSGNTTIVEKENEYIYLNNGIFDPDEEKNTNPLRLKIPCDQYIYLLETWGTKIYLQNKDKRPLQVMIYYEDENLPLI